jgi:hypothetical protein
MFHYGIDDNPGRTGYDADPDDSWCNWQTEYHEIAGISYHQHYQPYGI